MPARETTRNQPVGCSLSEDLGSLHVILQSIKAGVILVDPQTRIIGFANEAALKMAGCQREQLVGKVCHKFFCPAQVNHCPVLDEGKTVDHSDRVLVRRDGSHMPILKSVVPITLDGKPWLLESFEDISAIKQIERELQESRRSLAALMSNLPGMAFRCRNDHAWTMEFISEGALALTGYTAEELTASRHIAFAELIHPEDREAVWEAVQAGIAANRQFQMSYRIRTKEGLEKWVWGQGCAVPREGASPVMLEGFITEITANKRMEEEKAHLQERMLHLEKTASLERMAGALAHNLNNQLQVVSGNIELAADDFPEGSTAKANLDNALRATRQAAALGQMMLNYLGQFVGERETVDLAALCRDLLPVLRVAMPTGVHFVTELPGEGPFVLVGVKQVQQAITNLMTNAWEACDAHNGIVTLTLSVDRPATSKAAAFAPLDWQGEWNKDHACLAVEDNGAGIEPHHVAALFDPFFTTKFTGRGLGLPTVLGTARAHGGVIVIRTQPGAGSRFSLFLPLAEKPAGAPAQPEDTAPRAAGRAVLIVEDERDVRRVARIMIERLGFQVLEASSGAEALQLFREHRERVCGVICDLVMPEMDGWQTLEALLALDPELPFALATGYESQLVMAENRMQRAGSYLWKPYTMTGLKEALGQFTRCRT